MLIVLRDKGERPRKLSSNFSTIIWPVFSHQWQWSRKKARQHVLYRLFSPITTPDRLTATLCATDRLTATLCEKTSSDEVPHCKERRRGAARICEKISATSREKSQVFSYVHHLFNADTCHIYIHTLRWKDRPLQCPRCQSQDVDPWGTYHDRPGCTRSWCNGCKRPFKDLTDTLLHQSKRSLAYWMLATFLLCLSCSSRRIARELRVHSCTSYR